MFSKISLLFLSSCLHCPCHVVCHWWAQLCFPHFFPLFLLYFPLRVLVFTALAQVHRNRTKCLALKEVRQVFVPLTSQAPHMHLHFPPGCRLLCPRTVWDNSFLSVSPFSTSSSSFSYFLYVSDWFPYVLYLSLLFQNCCYATLICGCTIDTLWLPGVIGCFPVIL